MASSLQSFAAVQGVQPRVSISKPAKSFEVSLGRTIAVLSAQIGFNPAPAHAMHMMSTRNITTAASLAPQHAQQANVAAGSSTLLCTSLTAATVAGMLSEAQEAVAAGADIVELRIDYLEAFNPETDLRQLLKECPLPSIVTYRPNWEGYVKIKLTNLL